MCQIEVPYDCIRQAMENKGITQYDLYTSLDITKYTLDRLRHNKNVETCTLNKICRALACDISDIASYVSDDALQDE